MSNLIARRERRRDQRISPKGTVIVRATNYIIRGRIANLSRRGIATITRTTAPERLLGAPAELSVRLDARDATWFELHGRVLRIGAGSIVLGLDGVPAAFTRIFDETVSASHANDRLLSIVLVDSARDRRMAMATAFRAAGCRVVDVATPLEAIVRLGEASFEPDLIAIADSAPTSVSEELRRFVDIEHPRAHLVEINSQDAAPIGPAHWLSASNPADDLVARVRKVLTSLRR